MSSRPDRAQGTYYPFRKRRVFVPDGYLVVGQITSAHGLKGEVAVELHTDFPDRFQSGIEVRAGDKLTPMEIVHARPHKGNLLIQFANMASREDAESLRGLWLYIEEDEAAELDEGAYWIHDIIGLDVVSSEGVALGTVTDVMATGANDVYILQPAPGINGGRELLLPAIPEVIQDVNLEKRLMTVTLLPGLVDDPAPSAIDTAPKTEADPETEADPAQKNE
ncbi:MAG: ribosome maturation factor RimM [Litorilinea sp.]